MKDGIKTWLFPIDDHFLPPYAQNKGSPQICIFGSCWSSPQPERWDLEVKGDNYCRFLYFWKKQVGNMGNKNGKSPWSGVQLGMQDGFWGMLELLNKPISWQI